MGFFPRSKRPSCLSQVQVDLFNAVAKGDDRALGVMINRYDEIIRNEFASWKILPVPLRGDRRWEPWYGNGLIGVADYYNRSGINVLLQMLMGDDAENPIIHWQKRLEESAKALIDRRFDLVLDLLHPLLLEFDGQSGSAVDKYKTIALGSLGSAYYNKGDKKNAVKYTVLALQECDKCNDAEGRKIYTENLRQINAA